MLSDLRFAFRQFAKAPGFTAIIVLTLALSIGACTAIYSALDSIVLHPYDDPATKRNVTLRSTRLPNLTEGKVSLPDFLDIEQQAKSFEFMAHEILGSVTLTGLNEPLQVSRRQISPRYFEMVGITMAIGRAFSEEEFLPGRHHVAILSHAFWQRAVGGAANVIGRQIEIDGEPYSIVGVTAERFERTGHNTAVWMPRNPGQPFLRSSRFGFGGVMGRLRPGVTLESAQSELSLIAARLAEEYPDTNKGYGVIAVPQLQDIEQRGLASMIRILFAAVACLMLIACANVANLLLVRASGRQKELSVRTALGASRGRLVRQLLAESALLAFVGAVVGILLAQWALDFIRTSIPSTAWGWARLAHLRLDGSVLGFALVLTFATVLVFGLLPAWIASRVDLNEVLKQGTRGSTEDSSRGRLRAALVVVELALSITLLACGGLFIRSFNKLAAYNPGFESSRTVVARTILRGPSYATPAQRAGFVDALLSGMRTLPGIESAGVTTFFPFSTNHDAGFQIEGSAPTTLAERPLATFFSVTPEYFRAMGIPLRQGRFFSARDDAKAIRVALINQTLATQYFPNENPIGKRINIANGSDAWREIVGVVGDVVQVEIGEKQPNQLYEPFAQLPQRQVNVVVRATGSTSHIAGLIKTQVYAVDPNQPIASMRNVADFLSDKRAGRRLTSQLLVAFALIALFVAAIGIYGVIAFSVSQRTVEIGIRMALGAQKQDVLRLVLHQGAWLVGIGFAVGLVATFAVGRAIESQLYDTSGHDPVALVGITVFFAGVAALACWLPARRATKVDPIVALRTE